MNAEDKLTDTGRTLAIMAHDLKAPLSAVVNILSVVSKGYVTDCDKIKDLVARAVQKSETVLAMLDDILDYTLLQNRSKMKREKVDLFSVINESLSIMNHFAEERNLTLACEREFHKVREIDGNYTFLLRVFNNLIMNALKYNKENGSITLLYQDNPRENTITVTVRDTGIGIPEDELGNVFKVFERGRYARKNIDGSLGLGLSLVKQIIEDHYGKIEITSTVGVGTAVSITLPLIKKEEQKMSFTILVVDDDIDVLESRKIVLEHNNYDVRLATNIQVAREILEKEKIHLILLDVMMEKDSDGFNFAQEVKADDRFKDIPIIMATAVNQRTKFRFDIENDGDFLPVEKFMEKPIDPDDLIVTIRGLLK